MMVMTIMFISVMVMSLTFVCMMVMTMMFISVIVMTMILISMMVMPTIRHMVMFANHRERLGASSRKTLSVGLCSPTISGYLLITFHSDWRYYCYDCCDNGDAENQHTLFNIELIAIGFLWLRWLDDDVKNEPTLSNCEVIAPGRGNIRPSSKNSPQFQKSFTHNQSTRKYKLAKRMSVKTIS